jgi:hypothetical protein
MAPGLSLILCLRQHQMENKEYRNMNPEPSTKSKSPEIVLSGESLRKLPEFGRGLLAPKVAQHVAAQAGRGLLAPKVAQHVATQVGRGLLAPKVAQHVETGKSVQ